MTACGLRVPEDVAIVGYDDLDYAAGAAVPMTSVGQPRREIGARAAELLLDEVRAGAQHVHQHVMFTPSLVVVRQSSDLVRRVPAYEPVTLAEF
jgi:LacI family transcriptional regulator